MFKNWFKYGEKGFTLIEMLIVITVLGILAGVAVPTVTQFKGTAERTAATTEASNASTAAQSYLAEEGEFPANSLLLLKHADDEGAIPAYTGTENYLSAPLKAEYVFDSDTGQLTGVLNVTGGWANMLYDLSEHKWVKGNTSSIDVGDSQATP